MRYPQEILPDAIRFFKQLERKGITRIHVAPAGAEKTAGDDAAGEGGCVMSEKQDIVTSDAGGSTLEELSGVVSGCTACPLHETRTRVVFGVGNPNADVMLIGEAPGRDEDLKGEPFVGRAGQLLNKILAAIEMGREQVYITNILKCRPPKNRDPQESEVRRCESYLKAQIARIQPKVICALGRIASHWLLQTTAPLGTLRSGEHFYEGIPVLPTYHPAALLRNPSLKRPAWDDFKKLRVIADGGRKE